MHDFIKPPEKAVDWTTGQYSTAATHDEGMIYLLNRLIKCTWSCWMNAFGGDAKSVRIFTCEHKEIA